MRAHLTPDVAETKTQAHRGTVTPYYCEFCYSRNHLVHLDGVCKCLDCGKEGRDLKFPAVTAEEEGSEEGEEEEEEDE